MESFTFSVSNPSAGLRLGSKTHAVEILDDDAGAPVFTFGGGPGVSIPAAGAGTPYPSVISVSGVSGRVTKVIPKLAGFTHGQPDDVRALLVGPQGQTVMLLQGSLQFNSVSSIDLEFDDLGPQIPFDPDPFPSGTYRPFSTSGLPPMPAPAPADGYGKRLSAFEDRDPNGPWKLFVADRQDGNGGSLGGWSLRFETIAPPGPAAPPPGPPPPSRDRTKPRLTAFALSPATFRAAPRGGSLAAVRVGTKVSYRLSENARVTFRVERPQTGRRVGRRCVKQTRANRRRQACRRYVTMKGSFVKTSKAGANTARFTGRLRNRKLRPGSYRLVATARDAAGNTSSSLRKGFRVVR